MNAKNVWRILASVVVIALLLSNVGSAHAAPTSDQGPDSIVGKWNGYVNCWKTIGVETTCQVEIEIQNNSGEITLIDSTLTERGYTPEPWQHGLKGSSYCFNLYKDGNTSYPEGQECVTPTGPDSVDFYRELGWVEAAGTLARVGKSIAAPTTQAGAASCETVNGKVQHGLINIGQDIFVILCGERHLVPNQATLHALGIDQSKIDNMGMSEEELTAIPQGTDVPDVTLDTAGFQAFQQLYNKEVQIQRGESVGNPVTQGQVADKCSQYTLLRWLVCKIFGW